MISVAIVEDNQDIREGLQAIIQSAEGFVCPHVYERAETALRQLPNTIVDVVLVDIHLSTSSINGIALIAQLKKSMPHTEFIICTVYEDEDHIFNAIQAGATGYLLKTVSSAQLIAALKDVKEGGSPMSSTIARKVMTAFAARPLNQPTTAHALTIREQEVLQLLAQGLRYKEVAQKMFLSVDTIRTHVRNIYDKLQVSSKTAAVNKFFDRQ
jgi:DNA-binding NarL/FixJ family response regulator